VDDGTTWSPQDQILQGTSVHKGQVFSEQVAQPQPSVDDLRASGPVDRREVGRWLELPKLPAYVTELVNRLTRGKPTPYERARAISDYFANPANGFVYSLKTQPGDSGSALVDFLKNGSGYCQQYAAAMGVMLRAAGIPARVALGYMHGPVDGRGDFQVSTFDAHAWVEAFFAGIGWVPFDPTPPTGLAGGRNNDLSWAPHVYAPNGNDVRPTVRNSGHGASGPRGGTSSSTPVAAPAPHSGSDAGLIWFGLAVLLLAGLALIPAGVRATRRRQRYSAARRGDADALWTELSDTATDLGYVWSPARSPRQVSAWLARDAGATAPALEALAAAVEHRRYAPAPTSADATDLARGLHDVAGQLRSRRSRRMRVQALLWPASLGWGRRFGGLLPAVARHRR
jgi:transglutaminase-like putative cysteine protease